MTMSYTACVPPGADYVWIDVTGEFNIEHAIRFLGEATELCNEKKLSKVLLDIRGARSLAPIGTKYEFANQHMARVGLHTSWRILMLVDVADSDCQFMEMAMNNAGFQMRMFTDEKAGMEWFNTPHRPASP